MVRRAVRVILDIRYTSDATYSNHILHPRANIINSSDELELQAGSDISHRKSVSVCRM